MGYTRQGVYYTPSAAAPKKLPMSPTPSTPLPSSRSMTPMNPAIENLRGDLDSRPQTPMAIGLDKDKQEDFLRRENELTDSLAKKESALAAAEKLVKELREKLAFLKEQEASVNKASHFLYSFQWGTARSLVSLLGVSCDLGEQGDVQSA